MQLRNSPADSAAYDIRQVYYFLEVLMRKCMGLAFVATLLVAADDANKEYGRFEGTWKFISIEVDGMKLPDEAIKDQRLTCKGTQFTVEAMGGPFKGTFKVDASKKPKTIDVHFTEGPEKGDTLFGIYELEGDVYKVCMGIPGKPRPTEFASKPSSGHVLEILHREKK
jgi:uncharacterized protein (TIGR03067 family)